MALVTVRSMSVTPLAPDSCEAAEAPFRRGYPGFAQTAALDDLRASEFARLDAGGHVYLDYTGGGL